MRISKKKIISVIILLLLLIGLICGAVYLKKVADYKRAVVETTIGEIDIADVSDGIYIGEYDVNLYMPKWKLPCKMEKSQILTFWSTDMNVERPQKLSLTV